MMTIMLVIPILTFSNERIASANVKKEQNTTISITKETLTEDAKSLTLSLKDLEDKFQNITWYSKNKHTDHHDKASATKIEINNAKDEKTGKQIIVICDKFNFNTNITPRKAHVKTYWFIDKTEYATVDSKGIVTGRKAGTVILTAVAASSEAGVATSIVRDTVTIEIVAKENQCEQNNNDQNKDVKPQAKLVSLERTSEYTLTATFDSAIQTPGLVIVNTEGILGVVDSKNSTKVNYTLSTASALLTGYQKVSIGFWNGYNVIPGDKSAEVLKVWDVNFTITILLPLPAPTSVSQSLNDNNVVYVQFNNKLDEATAEIKTNYVVTGAIVVSAELINNTSGATVTLYLQQSSITASQTYLVTISGIKGYNNTYATMNSFQTIIALKENTPPILLNYNYSSPTTIILSFSEAITGTPIFAVIQNNVDIASYSLVSGNTVIIVLKNTPTLNVSMQLVPIGTNTITDLAGNKTSSILSRTITPTSN